MPRAKKGFTLIELMVVIAIISALAMVGLPTYKKYKIKANISDGVSILSEYRKALAILWSTDGKLPSENMTLPGPVDLPFNHTVTSDLSSNIESISLFKVNNGVVIKLIFSAELFPGVPANNRSLCLGAKIRADQIKFRCGNLSLNPQSEADIGFTSTASLPQECSYNGISNWLAMTQAENEPPKSPPAPPSAASTQSPPSPPQSPPSPPSPPQSQ